MTNTTIGIDVSKDHLDAHRLPDGAAKQFSNDAAGHKTLIRWIKAMPTDHIVFEATGLYSRNMELALTSAGLPAIKVNPRQARRSLIKDMTAAKNRQKIAADIVTIDAEVAELIAQDAGLAKRAAILTSIPGIGDLTPAILLIEMPELASIDAKQAASLAGLAPMTQASGTRKGKDHIRGGRATLRHALYLPALVAARFNPDLKRLHQRLTEAGKSPKVAITAVMRKLVIFANALLQKGRQWGEKTGLRITDTLKSREPAQPVRRYERDAPGDRIHIDIKKPGRFNKIGRRFTGDRTGQSINRGIGWEFVHVRIDDASRIAFAFLEAALATTRTSASTVPREEPALKDFRRVFQRLECR